MSLAAAAGVARLARFRADGLAAFDASPLGLLNAMAPWLGFALVGFGLALFTDTLRAAVSDLLASIVALLAPPVLSHWIAKLWGREAAWLRYAVAMTWCQWLMPPTLLAALLAGGALSALGLPPAFARGLAAFAALAYALALQVFLAARGLGLPGWRAVALVIVVNVGTLMLAVAPLLTEPSA